jgi:hypothetical protein
MRNCHAKKRDGTAKRRYRSCQYSGAKNNENPA